MGYPGRGRAGKVRFVVVVVDDVVSIDSAWPELFVIAIGVKWLLPVASLSGTIGE